MAAPDEIASELGQRLRACRLAQNFQQSELAARADISERALRNLERTGRGTLDTFLRVASTLGLAADLSQLFELKPKTIKDMELASAGRERASRKSP
ncbi:helix-turn-helix domain-containing protein [Trinickia terrae]|uniref:helix-turn-helix domain-containing protein n=1 Tax=Trinickia terrae TaxID=2571161 RepID=UPI00146C4024|nr:helix-turn-helix transcriptional regulator [Trinickia terrae]